MWPEREKSHSVIMAALSITTWLGQRRGILVGWYENLRVSMVSPITSVSIYKQMIDKLFSQNEAPCQCPPGISNSVHSVFNSWPFGLNTLVPCYFLSLHWLPSRRSLLSHLPTHWISAAVVQAQGVWVWSLHIVRASPRCFLSADSVLL